ncbi:MAG: hypothetical protein AAF196_16990 [Planctomycetota bacterium]
MVDADAWARALDRYVEDQLEVFFTVFHGRMALWMFSEVVRRTPVWENKADDPPGYFRLAGRARGSIYLSVGGRGGQRSDERLDPTGQVGIAEIAQRIASDGTLDEFVIGSKLSYIRVLEFGLYPNPPVQGTGRTRDGFSTQLIDGGSPPFGMFRTTIMDAPEAARGIAREVAREVFGR